MDRRTFLKTTTAAAAGSGLAAGIASADASEVRDRMPAPAVAGSRTELTFASSWAPDLPVLGMNAAKLFGRIQDVLGSDFRLVACADGHAVDLRLTDPDRNADLGLAGAYFAGLPGGMGLDPAQFQAWLAVGGGQMLWDEISARQGIKPLLAGHSGRSPGLWTSRPLTTAADFGGALAAVPGLGGLVLQELGATIVDAPPANLAKLISTGRVTVAEWANPLASLSLGLPGAATHFYREGLHANGRAVALEVRLEAWERLGPSARTALEGVAAQELAVSLAEALAHRRIAEDAIARTAEMAIARLPRQIEAAVDRIAGEMIEVAASASRDLARVRDSYLAFRQQVAGKSAPLWLA